MHKVIAEDGDRRRHRHSLRDLLETTEGSVRIASAYVTDTDLLSGIENRTVQVLTYLSRMDIVSGATSLESLRLLIERGANCRYLIAGPRLHAKVYVFGEQFAVVTSANLTTNALTSNIEVGVELAGSAVQELIVWFDAFWTKAHPLDVMQVVEWQQQIDPLRREYRELRSKAGVALPNLPKGAPPSAESLEELRDLLNKKANRFFCCNSNRRQRARSPAGGYELEDRMHSRGFAAAWESFDFPKQMGKVERGDVILIFAKGAGIVGIGCATGKRQILEPGDPDTRTERTAAQEAFWLSNAERMLQTWVPYLKQTATQFDQFGGQGFKLSAVRT
jgi:hypothetical protein